MKRFLPYLIAVAAIVGTFGSAVYASTPAFTSFQLSTTTPVTGDILETDGSGNHWVVNSGGSGTPGGSSGQLQYNGSGSFAGVSSTTLSGTGLISISNAPTVIGTSPSVASLNAGTNGQYLVSLNGVPTWQATTTVANGTGINCSFNAGALSMSCSFANIAAHTVLTNQLNGNGVPIGEATTTFGNTLYGVGADGTVLTESGGVPSWQAAASSGAFNFTPLTNWGVNTSATTTALWGEDSIFASSTSATIPAIAASNTVGPAALFQGNVGIGTTSPAFSSQFMVAGANNNMYFDGTNFVVGVISPTSPLNGAIELLPGGSASGPLKIYGPSNTLSGANQASFSVNSSSNKNFQFVNLGSGATTLLVGGISGNLTGTGANFVGISTSSPYAQLSLMAGGNYTSQPLSTVFAIGSSTQGLSTSTLLTVLSSGNVGIGSSSPNAALVVKGKLSIDNGAASEIDFGGGTSANIFYGGSTATNGDLDIDSPNSFRLIGAGGAAIFLQNSVKAQFGGTFESGVLFYINNSGNVGIDGTTTPGSLLSIGTASNTTGINFGLATSTFTNVGGINITTGCYALNGTCITAGGGSGITSITGPTGLSYTGTPTSVGTLATGYSIKELPSWTVGAAGADFTTIQAALTQCGAVGGGNIYLVDPSYSQGTTGLTWRGSNCSLWGRGTGTTTIAFTGATTGIKTNTPSGDFTHDEIHNVLFSGDNNASGVAIDWSDMTHGVVDGVQITGFARGLRLNDTQNITFYNSFTNMDLNAISVIGIDASSTNPVNGNYFNNIFIGSTVANVIGFQLDNGNGNYFNNIYAEPGSLTGTVGLKLFDNKLATNNGVFNNTFSNWYIEANATGVSIPVTVNPAAGGIQRNIFNNVTSEANTTDWSVAQGAVALNSFLNNYDSNFGDVLTSFEGPVGIGTSTEMQGIGNTPWAYFAVNASSTQATNEFAVSNQTANRSDLLVSSNGYLGLDSLSPTSRLTVVDSASADASVPTVSLTGDTNFAKNSNILKVANNNSSDTGTTTQIIDVGTGPALEVDDQANDTTPFVVTATGAVGISSTTPTGTAFGSAGTVYMSGLTSNATGDVVCISATKQILDSGGATCTPSTEKAKHDINSITPQEANEILLLNPVSYVLNGTTDRYYGLIAEQTLKVDPTITVIAHEPTQVPGANGLPVTIEPGQPLSVDYDHAVAQVIAEVQIQEKQIQALGGKPVRSMEENWQDGLIALLIGYALFNEWSKRRK